MLPRCALPWVRQQVVAHRLQSMLRTRSCEAGLRLAEAGLRRPGAARGAALGGAPGVAGGASDVACRPCICTLPKLSHRCQRRRRRWLACSSSKACWRASLTSSRRTAWSSTLLGSARTRLLRLLRAGLAALGGSPRGRGHWAHGHCFRCVRASRLQASNAAYLTAIGHPGRTRSISRSGTLRRRPPPSHSSSRLRCWALHSVSQPAFTP